MTKIVTQFVRNENKKIAKLGVDILAIKAYNKYIEIKQKGKNKMNNQLIEQIVEQAEQFNSFHKVSTLLAKHGIVDVEFTNIQDAFKFHTSLYRNKSVKITRDYYIRFERCRELFGYTIRAR
jgi:ribulose-5-phosphate 4-epimerase/fuculose-1-phosphate aldolase